MLLSLAAALLVASRAARAQLVVPDAEDPPPTVVRSPGDASVVITFREPRNVCATALDGQRQFTGWASIPGQLPSNLFFWFVEAREPTESLSVWLNGGPGVSSLLGFFSGNGPCEVVEKGLGQYDTVAREWGWDRASNMLYIDQPNHVGFSYDTPSNGTYSVLNSSISTPPIPPDGLLSSWASINGTFGTASPNSTANSTEAAAMAVWHLLQGFLTTFPQYRPALDAPVGLSLFGESYGGVYAPVMAEVWEAQNQRRLNGSLDRETTLELRLTSLGIINGCVDPLHQVPFYPVFAVNNTYGIKALSDREALLYLAKFSARGGCAELLTKCEAGRSRAGGADAICRDAFRRCAEDVENPYYYTGRDPYDIAGQRAGPVPSYLFVDYLNQPEVLRAIGSPVNFTISSYVVFKNFISTGDLSKGGHIGRLAALLRRGVRLGFIYGDRDYICNWFGGEAVSLAVARQAGGDYAAKFPAAGYAPIVVNSSYIGGDVRQFANLSFSRIFQAGHSVSAYQPETIFQVFARIIRGLSVSMGHKIDPAAYGTEGDPDSKRSDKAPEPPSPTCFVRAFGATCNEDASKLARSGGGVVINGVLYSKADDWPLATSRPMAASVTKTSRPSSAVTMTGVYMATETPSRSAGRSLPAWGLGVVMLSLASLVRLA
ncbi:hypothetical protein XA68_16551 [Ophiocordyceps unilateralis]|uniref:Carboxypeptidase n=1 Tax=Ophiocordyceps unilateralis TaxID=268505 RepID=A0A2A9P5Y7_OPHUN|nr:hypothetical protein XA68_16551 [Ophiocordyceps unilateralis]